MWATGRTRENMGPTGVGKVGGFTWGSASNMLLRHWPFLRVIFMGGSAHIFSIDLVPTRCLSLTKQLRYYF